MGIDGSCTSFTVSSDLSCSVIASKSKLKPPFIEFRDLRGDTLSCRILHECKSSKPGEEFIVLKDIIYQSLHRYIKMRERSHWIGWTNKNLGKTLILVQ